MRVLAGHTHEAGDLPCVTARIGVTNAQVTRAKSTRRPIFVASRHHHTSPLKNHLGLRAAVWLGDISTTPAIPDLSRYSQEGRDLFFLTICLHRAEVEEEEQMHEDRVGLHIVENTDTTRCTSNERRPDTRPTPHARSSSAMNNVRPMRDEVRCREDDQGAESTKLARDTRPHVCNGWSEDRGEGAHSKTTQGLYPKKGPRSEMRCHHTQSATRRASVRSQAVEDPTPERQRRRQAGAQAYQSTDKHADHRG